MNFLPGWHGVAGMMKAGGALWDLMDGSPQPRMYYNFNRPATLTGAPSNISKIANLGAQGTGGDADRQSATGPTTGAVGGTNSANCGVFTTSQWMRQAAAGIPTSSSNHAFVLLARRNSGTAGRCIGSHTLNWTFGYWNGTTRFWHANSNWVFDGTGGSAASTWFIQSGVVTSGVAAMFDGGTSHGTPLLTVSQGPGQVDLNGYSGSTGISETGDWHIFAFAGWNASISTDVRQRAEGALCWEAGLASVLAAGHPYKSAPPTK